MKLHHIPLNRAQLDEIPEQERILLVLLGHAANELNALTKLFSYCSKDATASTGIHREGSNAQTLLIGKLLTGKLYECWILLQNAFFGTQLSKIYEPLFDSETTNALNNLKRYFGRGNNLIETVRNRFAFHYAPDQISAGYVKLVDGEPLDIYLHDSNGNTLYAFAETIVGRSMLEAIDATDHAHAFDSLVKDTGRVIGWFNQVIAGCMITCLRRHVGKDLETLGAAQIQIALTAVFQSISIPYFVELPPDESEDQPAVP